MTITAYQLLTMLPDARAHSAGAVDIVLGELGATEFEHRARTLDEEEDSPDVRAPIGEIERFRRKNPGATWLDEMRFLYRPDRIAGFAQCAHPFLAMLDGQIRHLQSAAAQPRLTVLVPRAHGKRTVGALTRMIRELED